MGEPDFATPAPIVEALDAALAAGWTHYGDLNGDPELRHRIAELANIAANGWYDDDCVLVSHGGTAGITAAVLATVDPGDRVLIPEPTYSLYADVVRLAGGEPVFVPTTPDHHLDLDALALALPGARMITLCNPVNPTGVVFTRAELTALARLLADTETLLLADEAYADIVYPGADFVSTLSIPSLRERLIYCQTLSKTYAMTGWRVGYVVAPRSAMAFIRHAHRLMNSSINAATQRAALVALELGPATLAAPMIDAYQARRTMIMNRIQETETLAAHTPQGAFYVFARYREPLPSIDVVQLLRGNGVLVRAGSEYGPGGEGHIRISFAADLPTIDEGIRRIDTTLRLLD